MTSAPESEQSPIGTLWLLDLGEKSPDSPSTLARVAATFEQAGPGEAASIAKAMGQDDAAVVSERFAAGTRCYVARVGGTIASYGWVSLEEEWVSELGLHIRMSPGNAYIWDCASLPAYRGQGLYPALLSYIAARLRDEGFRRVWIGANTELTASQRGIMRVGFVPVADVAPSPGGPKPLMVIGRPGADPELVEYVRWAFDL